MDIAIEHLNKYSQGANAYRSSPEKVKRTTYCYPIWKNFDQLFIPKAEEEARTRRVSGHDEEVEKIKTRLLLHIFKDSPSSELRYCNWSLTKLFDQEIVPQKYDPHYQLEAACATLRGEVNTDSEISWESEVEESSDDLGSDDDDWAKKLWDKE